jgi:hypothetical protein
VFIGELHVRNRIPDVRFVEALFLGHESSDHGRSILVTRMSDQPPWTLGRFSPRALNLGRSDLPQERK